MAKILDRKSTPDDLVCAMKQAPALVVAAASDTDFQAEQRAASWPAHFEQAEGRGTRRPPAGMKSDAGSIRRRSSIRAGCRGAARRSSGRGSPSPRAAARRRRTAQRRRARHHPPTFRLRAPRHEQLVRPRHCSTSASQRKTRLAGVHRAQQGNLAAIAARTRQCSLLPAFSSCCTTWPKTASCA